MTYPQAREAFQQVATTDPRCGMAHWGIAMTLFQPLWPTRPGLEALRRGWEEVQKAKALQPPTERERLFVAAAEAFFLEPASPDYWLRIRRWGQAMEKVYASFPDDAEAATFYALAHLATASSNTLSRAHSDRAAGILLRVYERNPDHPGAVHYLVHANDVPGRERESLEITRIVPREPAALDWDRFTWPEAIARFARGLGAAHLGKIEEARAAGERLGELEAASRKAEEDLFARNIRMLRLELNAWLAHVGRQEESSVALMREAAELETSTPKHAVTPGPTLPAHELLGDLLMEQKQPAEALAAYKRSVELYPKRFNGLLGAARAAHALGDESSARIFYQGLLEVADGGTRQPALKEAENYAAQRR